MRNSLPFFCAARNALVAFVTFVAATTALAEEGKTYGQVSTTNAPVAISQLLDHPDDYVDKQVRVAGRVIDVCAKRGCWIELASDRDFESLIFKVDDGVISFPMETKGKWALAEGVFTKIQLDMEQTRRYEEYQCKEKGQPFDPATVTEPKVLYRLQGSGAVVYDHKPEAPSAGAS